MNKETINEIKKTAILLNAIAIDLRSISKEIELYNLRQELRTTRLQMEMMKQEQRKRKFF